MEIVGDTLHFQTITDEGRTIDSGTLRRRAGVSSAARTPDR
jgi:hypothetical protein